MLNYVIYEYGVLSYFFDLCFTIILSFNFKCSFDIWNGRREEEMNTIGIVIDILKYY